MRSPLVPYLAASALVAVLAFVLAPHPSVAAVPWALSCSLASAAILFGARRHRPRRPTFWRWVAAAVGAWGIAAAVPALGAFDASTASFQVGDLLYLPGYVALAAGAATLVRAMGPRGVPGLEAAIGTLALATFLWSLVIQPNVDGVGGASGLAAALFPLLDVALLMLVLRLTFSPLRGEPAVRLLAAATVSLVAADVAYFSPIMANGELAGRFVAAGYVVAYALFGAAALHPSMRRIPIRVPLQDESAPRRLLAIFGCAPLTMPFALIFNDLVSGRAATEPLLVIYALMVVLVLMRVGLLLRHVDSMRRRAEASEQRFRMVFDSAAQGISIGSEGMMTETNGALQRMLGYTGAEMSAFHYTEITHPDDRLISVDASDEVMMGSLPSHTFEKRLVHKDGSIVWVQVTLTRASDASFGISVIDDITARKALEEELRQAQKMEAIGKLAGGIAHDFNNVMMAVSGSAEVLLKEIEDGDPRREPVEIIASSAGRATDLTRKLLAFSRRQVLRLEAVDLAEAVEDIEPMLRRLIPANICITCELVTGAIARVDRPQLEQVLLNLTLNARDAMPSGGRLRISVRPVAESAELVVADDGVGMDEETSARVFEPFFTTKRSGTGLGLATVEGIVAQSGGTISVESSPGRGASFTIRLPLVDEPVARPQPVAAPPVTAESGRVLLVEDEELVRKVTAEMLRRSGYEVVTAASGEEAFALIETGDVEIDVLVTDVAMTGMNGQTLACRARTLLPALPVLFVSGYPAEVLNGDRMVTAGEEVLTKPFSPAELAERIELVRSRAAAAAPYAASASVST